VVEKEDRKDVTTGEEETGEVVDNAGKAAADNASSAVLTFNF
jgi:hypothetical protein